MTNDERPWTRAAIVSILAQTTPPEALVILVESGNDWIESELDLAAKETPRSCLIEVHRIPLARLGAVRNAGVQFARTKWVAFLDGDDIWMRNRLELQLAAAKRDSMAQFVAGDFVFINSGGYKFGFPNGSTPTPSSWLVECETMRTYPFDSRVSAGEDYLWLQATRGHVRRIRVPRVLVGYRIRLRSISSLHHGATRQRRIREAMARASQFALIRYALLLMTYMRYRMHLGRKYAL